MSDDELAKLAHDRMFDYVDMGHFRDWEFALKLLKEGFTFGYRQAELAKVAEPMDRKAELVQEVADLTATVSIYMIANGRPEPESPQAFVDRIEAAGLLAQPVVLDLSALEKRMWTRHGMAEHSTGLSIHLPDLLAAIRAQLPGIEVRV